ncbi:MAG: helix-turn-helix domain-containing protein, partial [Pyrinomonadaceae bacterium]
MTVFSERGFRGTTTREIARAAGVSEAIIFRHFATKEELYSAILDRKACAGDMAEIRRTLSAAIARGDDRAVF